MIKKGRTKKIGLLSEREKDFLKGKEELNYHQWWDFQKKLDKRIRACIEDVELIWESTKTKSKMKQWAQKNWRDLYTLAENIHPRKYGTLEPYKIGKIRTFSIKEKNRQRNIIHYWYDENDKTPKRDLDWPDYMLVGIKPKSVKDKLKKMLEIEDDYKYKTGKQIIPRTEYRALSITKLEKKFKKMKLL